jgi:hypothetical protein
MTPRLFILTVITENARISPTRRATGAGADLADLREVARIEQQADVAQLVEQLIRNQ